MFDEDLLSRLENIVKENPGSIQKDIRKIYNQGPWPEINKKRPINKHLYGLADRGKIRKGNPPEGKQAPTWWPIDDGASEAPPSPSSGSSPSSGLADGQQEDLPSDEINTDLQDDYFLKKLKSFGEPE